MTPAGPLAAVSRRSFREKTHPRPSRFSLCSILDLNGSMLLQKLPYFL